MVGVLGQLVLFSTTAHKVVFYSSLYLVLLGALLTVKRRLRFGSIMAWGGSVLIAVSALTQAAFNTTFSRPGS